MSMNVKLKNFALAASFARRLLELNPSAKFAQDARKVLAAAEQNNIGMVVIRGNSIDSVVGVDEVIEKIFVNYKTR